MKSQDLPIVDTSLEGRKEYVNRHKSQIEITIMMAFDSFSDQDSDKRNKLLDVFGDDTVAANKIIKAFTSESFDIEKAPRKDLTLFTQPNFWLKYLTGGRIKSDRGSNQSFDLSEQSDVIHTAHEDHISILGSTLNKFNDHVASDLVGFWLMANRKLLRELKSEEKFDNSSEMKDILLHSSDGKKTKYKADACFRYLYLLLDIQKKVDSDNFFSKYLIAGKNTPQYTSNKSESHELKKQIRKEICKIIDTYQNIHSNFNASPLEVILMNQVARKSLVDLYEFDKTIKGEYADKLYSLRKIAVKGECNATG